MHPTPLIPISGYISSVPLISRRDGTSRITDKHGNNDIKHWDILYFWCLKLRLFFLFRYIMLIYSSQVVFEVFALAGVRRIVNRNVYTPNICGYRSLQILEKQWGTVTTSLLMLIRVCIYICVWGGAGGRRTEVAAAINSLCFYWRLFSYIIQSYH